MFSADVSAYVSGRGVEVTWGAEIGDTVGRLDGYTEYGDVARVVGATLTNLRRSAILQQSVNLFIPGQANDILVRTM